MQVLTGHTRALFGLIFREGVFGHPQELEIPKDVFLYRVFEVEGTVYTCYFLYTRDIANVPLHDFERVFSEAGRHDIIIFFVLTVIINFGERMIFGKLVLQMFPPENLVAKIHHSSEALRCFHCGSSNWEPES